MVTRRPVVVGAVALAVVLTSSAGAGAQETGPVVVADDVELSTAADGVSTFSATVTITGADGPTVVSILVDGAQSCVPLSQPVVASGVATPITLKLPSTCELADPASVEFVTYPLGSVAPTPSGTRVTPDVQIADASPAYINLAWGFGLGALLAAVVTTLAWKLGPNARWGRWPMRLGAGLPGLNGKWTWENSQLTNVTVVAALFSGLLGSTEVLGKILGDDGDSPTAVVVVASALAGALVAAAPFMLAMLRDEPETYATTDAPNNYRASGVLFATALVEAASLGLILSIAWTLWDGEIPNPWIVIGAGVAALLALVYGARSMRRTLKIGMVESKVELAVRTADEAGRKADSGRSKDALETAQHACDAASGALLDAKDRLEEPPPGTPEAAKAVATAIKSRDTACTAVRETLDAANAQPHQPGQWEPAAKEAVTSAKEMAAVVARAIKAVDAARAARGVEAAEGTRTLGGAEAREIYREPAMP